jgi:hypothetical protein
VTGNTERPAGQTPPAAASFARGGLIRPAGTDAPPPWLSGCIGTAMPGRVFVAPIEGDGPWRDIGTIDSDGITLTPPQRDGDEVAQEFSFDGVTTSQLQSWGSTGIAPATHSPAGAGVDILEQIDRAVDRLCPCGAEPDEEFDPYCSYDCTPNYHARHTISDRDGTQMRWRPDLVTEVDDTGLSPYSARQRYGNFYVEFLQRAGTERLHVRVDDGHRWVGSDFDLLPAEDFEQRYEAKLRALLRELENNRHAVPSSPGPAPLDVQMRQMYTVRLLDMQIRERAHRARWEQHVRGGYHSPGPRTWGHRAVDIWPRTDHIHWVNPPREQTHRLADMIRSLARLGVPLVQAGQAAATLLGRLRELGLAQPERQEAANQREETLRRVREARNAGPRHRQRAPRRIDPRRDR